MTRVSRFHHPLCLTQRNDGDCNCKAIAECAAKTHHLECPCRNQLDDGDDFPYACECADIEARRSHE